MALRLNFWKDGFRFNDTRIGSQWPMASRFEIGLNAYLPST